jgi:hypothetical protein
MDCPKCGYAMSEFDTQCPRCKRMGAGAPPQASPAGPTPSTSPAAPAAPVVPVTPVLAHPEMQSVEVYEVDMRSYLKMAALQLAILYVPTMLLVSQLGSGERSWSSTLTVVAVGYVAGLLAAAIAAWSLNAAVQWGGGLRLSLRVRQHVTASLYELRHVGPLSGLRVGLLAGLLLGLLAFLMSMITEMWLLQHGGVSAAGQEASFVGQVVVYTIGGGLGGLIGALLYNGLSALVGGIRFRMG